MLKIIISPAKKMSTVNDYVMETTTPFFREKAEALKRYLQSLSYGELKTILKCNDKIAGQNYERFCNMDLSRDSSPAVLAYEGIQYQSMAPYVFDRQALEYIGEHLYILSGFYGILRAFDGVVPYRLEMQAKLSWESPTGRVESLYDYWGRDLYRALTEADVPKEEPVTIINLASKEYSRAIEPWREPQVRMVTCVFGEMEGGRVRVKATAAKMARGSMVRFMAENQVTESGQLKSFDWMGYRYREELSDSEHMIFAMKNQ